MTHDATAGRAGILITAVAAVGAGLHGASVAAWATASHALAPLLGGVLTGLAVAKVFGRVRRATSTSEAITRVVWGSIVIGVSSALVSLIVRDALTNAGEFIPAMLCFAPCVGVLAGGVIGLVLSIPAAFVPWSARVRTRSTLLWLALVLGLWLAAVAAIPALQPLSPDAARAVREPAWWAMLAGVAVAFAAAIRLVCRARWLARVSRGLVPGYAVVPVSTLRPDPELVPWGPLSFCDAILVREHAKREGAYRGLVAREPIAYVSAPELNRG